MAASSSEPKLLVIVGPTASGKSDLAMWAAQRFNGEIISADSRSLYRGMDVGTAKPSSKDRRQVKHWGLDLINPDEKFSAKRFKDYALTAIKDIQLRGKLPILAGGTGLYIDSVVFDYDFNAGADVNPLNPRHRLKKGGASKTPGQNTIVVGIDPGKDELELRLKRRLKSMLESGLLAEIKILASQYPNDIEAFKAPGYQAFLAHNDGKIDLAEAKKLLVQTSLQLAKKQRTWFKRNPYIEWFPSSKEAKTYLKRVLNT
ncbi:MAG TPA: tRNA (adenosine(37)-N6)-dimethylallyltransferase MiaA [Candidatus Saccharimonadales bacterium]|nr:tRNA (adenosine(37)-N6)-dimethylallyltransferase MiaA [Candidatus Saccharimonadales bacterium]